MKKIAPPRFWLLAKEGAWIVAGQVATVFGALLLVRMLTEYLDPVQFGQLALGLTAAVLVNQVVMGGVAASIGRFYSIAVEKNDLPGYLYGAGRLMLYATIAVLVIALLLMAGLFLFGYSHSIALVGVAFVYAVLNAYNSTLGGIQNAARQRAVVAIHGGIDAWLKILLSIGVVLWLGNSSISVILGYALSSLIVSVSQFFFLWRSLRSQDIKLGVSTTWTGQMWGFSWPFCIFGIFTWMQIASDRWALQTFASTEAVGLYAVVFQLGYSPIGMATGMVMTFLGPILYQRSGSVADHARNESVHRISWQITFIGLAVTALAFVFTYALHEWIFNLLVAERYLSGSYLLPWVTMAGGLFAAGQLLALKLMSEMKPSVMTMAKVVTAILGVFINIYGASKFGANGVVAGLVAFSSIYFFWMALLAHRIPSRII